MFRHWTSDDGTSDTFCDFHKFCGVQYLVFFMCVGASATREGEGHESLRVLAKEGALRTPPMGLEGLLALPQTCTLPKNAL